MNCKETIQTTLNYLEVMYVFVLNIFGKGTYIKSTRFIHRSHIGRSLVNQSDRWISVVLFKPLKLSKDIFQL